MELLNIRKKQMTLTMKIKEICTEMSKSNKRIKTFDCVIGPYVFKNLTINLQNKELHNNFYINEKYEIVDYTMNIEYSIDNGFHPGVKKELDNIYVTIKKLYYDYLNSFDNKIKSFQYKTEDEIINKYIQYLKNANPDIVKLRVDELNDFCSKIEFDFLDEFVDEMNNLYHTSVFRNKKIQSDSMFQHEYSIHKWLQSTNLLQKTIYSKFYSEKTITPTCDNFKKTLSLAILGCEHNDVFDILNDYVNNNVSEYRLCLESHSNVYWTTAHPFSNSLAPFAKLDVVHYGEHSYMITNEEENDFLDKHIDNYMANKDYESMRSLLFYGQTTIKRLIDRLDLKRKEKLKRILKDA